MEERAAGKIPDTILFVEHPPVITLGKKSPGVRGDFPAEINGVPVHAVERGGEATFHGPGQIVAYPILMLNGKFGPKSLLRAMENAMVATLAEIGLAAYWIEGKTGVWLKDAAGRERKIASLGVAVRKSVSYHGLALNISTDLSFFRLISPCGFEPAVMTSVEEQRGEVPGGISARLERNLTDALRPLSQTEKSLAP